MARRITLFAIVSFLPVPLIALAAILGGWWVMAACFYITLFIFALDELVCFAKTPEPLADDFAAANALSTLLAVAHFILLFLVVWALSSNPQLGALGSVGLFIAAGLFFGQVSNSNAHELIHRSDKRLFRLGKWVYTSLLFGHHTSAHLLVHHRFAASDDDPNSAAKGESFYTFAQRAWTGSALAGFEMENHRRKNLSKKPPRFSHPYYGYAVGAFASLGLGFMIGGWGGVMVLLGLSSYAQVQLLLSDYVQHYGLRRATLPNGKLAPVGLHHSWNAPQWLSNYLMLAAPRHSDHHAHPAKPYPALILPAPDIAPSLPHSLPAMALIALYPRLWRHVMDPRVTIWEERARNEAQQMAVQNALLRDPVSTATGTAGHPPLNLPKSEHETPADAFARDATDGPNPDGRSIGRRGI